MQICFTCHYPCSHVRSGILELIACSYGVGWFLKGQILHNDSFQTQHVGKPPSLANKKFDLGE